MSVIDRILGWRERHQTEEDIFGQSEDQVNQEIRERVFNNDLPANTNTWTSMNFIPSWAGTTGMAGMAGTSGMAGMAGTSGWAVTTSPASMVDTQVWGTYTMPISSLSLSSGILVTETNQYNTLNIGDQYYQNDTTASTLNIFSQLPIISKEQLDELMGLIVLLVVNKDVENIFAKMKEDIKNGKTVKKIIEDLKIYTKVLPTDIDGVADELIESLQSM